MANFQHFDIGDSEDNPKRFASLEASDLDELLEAAHSKRTKYSTNFAVSVYPPHSKGIKFSKNPVFMRSNMILDAKIKNLKQLGKQNIRHEPAITTTDLKKLRVHPVISARRLLVS